MQIGFIGQGYIGKNYADEFEARGFNVVRYALEEPHVHNGDRIASCDVVFVAVPTPTTTEGFDDRIVQDVLKLVGKGCIAIIKSTVLPGSTEKLQELYPEITILHSPEFLRERSSAHDAAHPVRNIIGVPQKDEKYLQAAQFVLSLLPKAPYSTICHSRESELIKYAGNCFLYMKVIFANLLYDAAEALECDWQVIHDAVVADPRIGESHFNPVHASGHAEHVGRGAGGHCFIKDFAAFRQLFESLLSDPKGVAVLKSLEEKNQQLLRDSNKDTDLLDEIYGPVA